MDDQQVKTITDLIKLQDPDLLDSVPTDGLPNLINRAYAFVASLNPPKSALNQLVMLYTGALLNIYDGGELSSVKINNIQVTSAATGSGNAWLDEFNALLSTLGLNLSKVVGF